MTGVQTCALPIYKWNKYIFRTGRNSSQDAISNAVALDKPGVHIATLAQDYAFGRDGVKAFKEAVKKAKLVHEEYLPANTTDFTAGAQRLIDKLKDLPGRKVIWIIWAGAGNPFKIADLDLKRYGIEIATGGNILPAMTAYKQFPGMEGATYYYFGMPKNPVNEWLVANHYTKFKSPPDFFTAGGMTAGIAVVDLGIDLVGLKEWPVLQQYGLTSTMCNGAEINLVDGWNDKKFHPKLIQNYTEMIPLVAKAGYKNLICFSGSRRGIDDETGWNNCAEGLKQIMGLAEKNGVTIVMELLNSKVDHKDYQCDRTAWGVELCKRTGSSNFKLLYDIYHMQKIGRAHV